MKKSIKGSMLYGDIMMMMAEMVVMNVLVQVLHLLR